MQDIILSTLSVLCIDSFNPHNNQCELMSLLLFYFPENQDT